jgi:hypothetical protein
MMMKIMMRTMMRKTRRRMMITTSGVVQAEINRENVAHVVVLVA